jgi:hypothetical protein
MSADAVEKVEVVEGTYSLACPATAPSQHIVRGADGLVGVWPLRGYEGSEVCELEKANLIHSRVALRSASGKITETPFAVATLTYASPKPLGLDEISRRAEELSAAWKQKHS